MTPVRSFNLVAIFSGVPCSPTGCKSWAKWTILCLVDIPKHVLLRRSIVSISRLISLCCKLQVEALVLCLFLGEYPDLNGSILCHSQLFQNRQWPKCQTVALKQVITCCNSPNFVFSNNRFLLFDLHQACYYTRQGPPFTHNGLEKPCRLLVSYIPSAIVSQYVPIKYIQ